MTKSFDASQVEHSHATAPDGRRFHLVKAGTSGPKIVFLHGYIDSWRSFEGMFPYLSDDFLLIAIDQRGHGGTDPADDYAIADFVSDAITMLGKSAEPVHLVGHSLGAIVAHRVASQAADKLLSITLIGGAVTSKANAGLSELYDGLASLDDPIPYAFAYDFQKSTAFQPLAEEKLDGYVQESLKVKARTWKKALRGLIDDVSPGGPAPEVPTLVIWGAHDEVFPLADQELLRDWMPGATFVNYPDLGHAPQWEDPARVSQDLRAFIASVGPKAE